MTLGFAYSQEPDPQITNMTKVVICTSDKKSLIKAESLKVARIAAAAESGSPL